MITMANLATRITLREGKKSKVRIGDVREICKIIVMLEVEAQKAGKDEERPVAAITEAANKVKQKLKKV